MSGSDLEGSGSNLPALVVSGRVDVATTIPIAITGGTANSSDYAQTASGVSIPIGIYAGQSFPLPISITEDAVLEPDDTLDISVGTPSTSEVLIQNIACNGTPPITSATYTVVNDDGQLTGTKSVEAFDGTINTPGSDVIYSITISNQGAQPTNSIFIVDTLPAEVSFYNNDYDGPGPATDPVGFSQSGTGLSFDYSSHVGFSSSTMAPTGFAGCNYVPTSTVDTGVRHVCVSPTGSLPDGSPDPSFTVRFRARIK